MEATSCGALPAMVRNLDFLWKQWEAMGGLMSESDQPEKAHFDTQGMGAEEGK